MSPAYRVGLWRRLTRCEGSAADARGSESQRVPGFRHALRHEGSWRRPTHTRRAGHCEWPPPRQANGVARAGGLGAGDLPESGLTVMTSA